MTSGDIFHPALAQKHGYEAEFRQCHITAEVIKNAHGWPMIMGLSFLDKHNKLLVWPHVVNESAPGFWLDFSPAPKERVLGFAPFNWDAERFNSINADYDSLAANGLLPSYGDPLADKLTADFLEPLRNLLPVAGKDPVFFI